MKTISHRLKTSIFNLSITVLILSISLFRFSKPLQNQTLTQWRNPIEALGAMASQLFARFIYDICRSGNGTIAIAKLGSKIFPFEKGKKIRLSISVNLGSRFFQTIFDERRKKNKEHHRFGGSSQWWSGRGYYGNLFTTSFSCSSYCR
ncbi:hypothetical protein Lser_V15G06014 [Lactuca serriola]